MISCCGGRVSGEENYRRFEGLVVVAQPLDFRLQLVDFGPQQWSFRVGQRR